MSLFGKILKVAVGAGTGYLTGGPAGAVAGGVSGLSSVLSKSATGKALGTQADAVGAASNLIDANKKYQYDLNAPSITGGNGALGAISGFLNGGAGGAGLDAFRGSTGWQDLLKTGLNSVNANAYAKGAGDSGAALKALQEKGTSLADQSAQGWLGNEFNLAGIGQQALSRVAGIGQNAVDGTNKINLGLADDRSNGTLKNSSDLTGLLSQFGADAVKKLGSSFGGGGGSTESSWSPSMPTNFNVANFKMPSPDIFSMLAGK